MDKSHVEKELRDIDQPKIDFPPHELLLLQEFSQEIPQFRTYIYDKIDLSLEFEGCLYYRNRYLSIFGKLKYSISLSNSTNPEFAQYFKFDRFSQINPFQCLITKIDAIWSWIDQMLILVSEKKELIGKAIEYINGYNHYSNHVYHRYSQKCRKLKEFYWDKISGGYVHLTYPPFMALEEIHWLSNITPKLQEYFHQFRVDPDYKCPFCLTYTSKISYINHINSSSHRLFGAYSSLMKEKILLFQEIRKFLPFIEQNICSNHPLNIQMSLIWNKFILRLGEGLGEKGQILL